MARLYRRSTQVLGLVICGLGVALVVLTLARGGGPLALGVLMGFGLAVFGAGRAYLAREGDQ